MPFRPDRLPLQFAFERTEQIAGFVEDVKASGFVGEAITRNKSAGVNAAPPASR